MAKYISEGRLKEAIARLAAVKDSAHKQNLQHILPFLAIKRKGVNTTTDIQFEEADDNAFWDKFFLVDPDDTEGRYYDPFAGARRIATHWHSNIATLRKGTFVRSWGAATMRVEDGKTYWHLNEGYLEILKDKCLTKAGVTTVIPALDLALWMRREDELPDDATADWLVAWFQSEFELTDEEFETLFVAGQPAADANAAGEQAGRSASDG